LEIVGDGGDADLCDGCVAELRLAVQLARSRGVPFAFDWGFPEDQPMVVIVGDDATGPDVVEYSLTDDTEVTLTVEEGDRQDDVIVLNGKAAG
jgi:hypothetical protein